MNSLTPDSKGMSYESRIESSIKRLKQLNKNVVLLVTHNCGGGVQKHLGDLEMIFADHITFIILKSCDHDRVELSWRTPVDRISLRYRISDNLDLLTDTLAGLGVGRIHYHHLLGHGPEIVTLPDRLNVPYDFTVHDYHTICPRIHLTADDGKYCMEQGEIFCNRCLSSSNKYKNINIKEWRETFGSFLRGAQRVFIPSHDAGERLLKYFPGSNFIYAPHPETSGACPIPTFSPKHHDSPITIAIIGAMTAIKGKDILQECALDASKRRLPIHFILIGYSDLKFSAGALDKLLVHGMYENANIKNLLDRYKTDVAWFPSQCPETYSYALSEVMTAGLPVVASNLGAFTERLNGRPWSWVLPWNMEASAVNDMFVKLKEKKFLSVEQLPVTGGRASDSQFQYGRDYLVSTSKPTGFDEQAINSLARRLKASVAIKKKHLGFLEKKLLQVRQNSGLWNMSRRMPSSLKSVLRKLLWQQ